MSRKRSVWNRGIETRILRVYNSATPEEIDFGIRWYSLANSAAKAISERWEVPIYTSAGVIAALSPGLNWGRNVTEADELINAWVGKKPLPIVGVYGRANVEKCKRILSGANPLDVLGGSKVRAFFANILFPCTSDAITIDRHAKALAYGLASERSGFASNDKLSIVRPGEYEYIAWHYRKLAERMGLVPNQLQAICWVVWKRLGEEN